MDSPPTPPAADGPSAPPTRFPWPPRLAVRHPAADLEEMVGMGYFPEEVGLPPGIHPGPQGQART